MSEPIITVEKLSKCYLVGHQSDARSRYIVLRDVIAKNAREFVRKAADLFHGRQIVQGDEVEDFWALKDVSFEVKRGEVLGIIGRNGAGKSTLLKILSRITEPTEGRVILCGRVASLLEVGTGFHPELTGRENIFLNGAILGMTQREIRKKFDEIVAFAEVDRFLDTPVKRYSSGMYVRLAFAVAAHLEPEILVVDEVLAVGDTEFQKKCLGKMRNVAGHGRTVLFVSHNMAAIRALCTRSILLVGGSMKFDGDSDTAITRYLDHDQQSAGFKREPKANRKVQIVEVLLDGLTVTEEGRRWLSLSLGVLASHSIKVNIDIRLHDAAGTPVGIGSMMSQGPAQIRAGLSSLKPLLDVSALAVGQYSLSVDITIPWAEYLDRLEDCLQFTIGAEHWNGVLHVPRQDWNYGSLVLPIKMCEESVPEIPFRRITT